MKLYQKIIYLILLLLVGTKAFTATVRDYTYLDNRYFFGKFYDSKFDFYVERLREGMFIEPLLLILMVIGLFIRKYAGWMLTLLLPTVTLIYTIANLIGLADFWGIIDIPVFIFYYVLLIVLNVNNVRQIFKVDSIKKTLQGNLTNTCLSIGLLILMILIRQN